MRMGEITDGAWTSLSLRERQVLAHMANGLTYSAIAKRMQISRHTVDTYFRRIRAKTGVRNRMQLLMYALRLDEDTEWAAEEPRPRPGRARDGSHESAPREEPSTLPPNSAFLPVFRHRGPAFTLRHEGLS
ncbi:DNA-binding CsgD family transcriptional regulator [Streptomyces sp. B3I8]|jgi:DNA-binding CsgD family transcriptional regulator|nr:DNA-binding CsgD family transcriptional regulator [Streptomyces sp. B3I8]